MMALEKQMRIAMRETLKSALESVAGQAYEQWLLSWPAQVGQGVECRQGQGGWSTIWGVGQVWSGAVSFKTVAKAGVR